MIKQEFQLVNLKLIHTSPKDFASSDWFPLPVVIVYRTALAVYCFVWLVFSGFSTMLGGDTWFIYLTDWTYTCVTVYFLAAATLSTTEYVKQRRQSDKYRPLPDSDAEPTDKTATSGNSDDVMYWYHKALWVLYSMAADMAVVVTVSYWTLLYHGFKIYLLNVNVHLLNSVFMLAETMLCSIPIRLFHVVYPFCYGAVYILFTVVYWSLGGKNNDGQPYIYPVLDYTHALRLALGVAFGVPLVVLPLVHVFMYGIYRLRCCFAKKDVYE
ncbi:predicted protein [Nematostella vectensis]|uniref:Protein rolling stone n=1 Tax=Nematostella vectensis TaxID=45351 RepID=A7RTP9_NEMVE|nr:predicted protein [Nematostella vectensis]|eukprot:XP_001637129.1 predicted protein [Nematostella vectensis]